MPHLSPWLWLLSICGVQPRVVTETIGLIFATGLHRKILAKTFPREHLEKCVGVWGCHRDLSWGCSWHLSGMVTTLHREEPPCQPYNSGPAEKLARQVRSESREGGYS